MLSLCHSLFRRTLFLRISHSIPVTRFQLFLPSSSPHRLGDILTHVATVFSTFLTDSLSRRVVYVDDVEPRETFLRAPRADEAARASIYPPFKTRNAGQGSPIKGFVGEKSVSFTRADVNPRGFPPLPRRAVTRSLDTTNDEGP